MFLPFVVEVGPAPHAETLQAESRQINKISDKKRILSPESTQSMQKAEYTKERGRIIGKILSFAENIFLHTLMGLHQNIHFDTAP